MRCALYARVSMDDGTRDTENQLVELRAHAAKLGHDVVAEYVDYASGKNGDRERFQAMLHDATAGQFDVLLFWALDRLTREGVYETLSYLRQLDQAGVCWLSHTEAFFDSCGPFKDAVISIMATLAKLERQKISERTKAGLRRAQSAGKRLGRAPLEIDVTEIRAMQTEGYTLASIAQTTGINLRTIMRRLAS